ncbi:MAG: hypothetical protein CK427_16240, partial [Leptospira sp.]
MKTEIYRNSFLHAFYILFTYFLVMFSSCIAQEEPNKSLALLMPWEYGDNISVNPINNTNSLDEKDSSIEEVDVWSTDNPIAKGYLVNWLLFSPNDEDEISENLTITDFKSKDAIQIDASNPIPLPHSPSETLLLRERIHKDNQDKKILPQNIDEPTVYHARIFISSSVELQYLKELIIPYSIFPYFEVEGMNYHPTNQQLVGHIDWSEYTEGGFVYVILTGYHYNFILMNELFQAIEIIKELKYEELALLNFDLSMSGEQLQTYTDQLHKEANEWKVRDNQAYLQLQRFIEPPGNYQFAIFGVLRGGLTRIFSNVWNKVRVGVIKATAQLTNRLKFDLNRLSIPEDLRNRMKFKPSEFLKNAFTPPKWIRDRLKPPKWLRDKLKLSQYKPLRGMIEVLDANGKVFNFKRQDRKMTLDWTPIEFRVGPQLPGDLQDFNPFDLLTQKSTTFLNGIFNKNLQATVPIIGTPISYNLCYNLDNAYSKITDNGIFPKVVCAGQFKPREFPYFIQIKNPFSQTAAMIQFSNIEAIHKLGIFTKRVNVFQGGLMNPAEWKPPGIDGISAFAPCGQIIHLQDYHKAALFSPQIFTLAAPFMTYDIYLKKYDDFLTVVHEFSHIAHCSLIGESKYREQISKYAEDVVQGVNPRRSEYGKMHEGIANYFEFILNGNMSYCPGCNNIEANLHTGYMDEWIFLRYRRGVINVIGGSIPHSNFDIYYGGSSLRYINTLPLQDDFDSNQTVAISSFLYDLEDSCKDSFRTIIRNNGYINNQERFHDRVNIGRSNLIHTIQYLPYPAKLQDITPIVLGLGVTQENYWELVDLHGLNGLTKGLELWNPYDTTLFGTFTIKRKDETTENLQCFANVSNIIQQDLNLASNIEALNIQPKYRMEKTNILELDKSKSIESFQAQHVPTNAIAVTWKKENPEPDQPKINYTNTQANTFETNELTWTDGYGIDWLDFLEESTPLYSTNILWNPIGKETKDMGVIDYTRVDPFTSPAIEHFWFTSAMPEYQAQNRSFEQFFEDVKPEDCRETSWNPIGKPVQSMGTECWTGVGFFIIPLYEDYCSDLIEYDQRHTVSKSPVSINEHFVHYYDRRVGTISCNLHTKTSSGLMEYDERPNYTFPAQYYGNTWNHLYFQKDGRIQFQNASSIDS